MTPNLGGGQSTETEPQMTEVMQSAGKSPKLEAINKLHVQERRGKHRDDAVRN